MLQFRNYVVYFLYLLDAGDDMSTLIELYDERPIENVLATEVFRPERTVFLCPPEIAHDKKMQKKLAEYFAHQGLKTKLEFLESSLFYTNKVLKQLRSTVLQYGDCMLDITGGTDAALFACGQLCAEMNIPAFTYSRRKNCFYNIQNAEFAENKRCDVKHNVEDCFLMAGGAMRGGRVNNSILSGYMDRFDAFFRIYLKYRTQWTKFVQYIQKTSQGKEGEKPALKVDADFTVKGERNARIDAPKSCLYDLEKIGFLSDVEVCSEHVSYTFRDCQIRTWLRDIGSVLELYIYKACIDTGIFNDVYTSAVVDWEGDFRRDNVTNEIDVMAMQGTLPAFISCKTCSVTTEALNELAILRDRFGGNGAKAAIVTTQQCRSITRHRASELNIDVIDLNDLKSGCVTEHIKAVMRKV